MIEAFLAADVAAADRARLADGADLMSTAAAALATTCAEELVRSRGRTSGARVVLLVGPGNNGGDALLAGALLRRRGAGVLALLCAPEHHEPGAQWLLAAGGAVEGVEGAADEALAAVRAADLVVDGILGIGADGAVRGPGTHLLEALQEGAGLRPPVVVACDLPSGVHPDSGAVSGPVLAADVTVTFGAAKPGLLVGPGADLVGRLRVVDLGLRPHLPDAPALQVLDQGPASAAQVAEEWPWPWRRADKYARGVVGLAAGSDAFPGAAVLSVTAAVSAGAGMVRYLPPTGSDGSAAQAVLREAPEAVPDPLPGTGRVQAWVVGPGVSDPDDDRVRHVLGAGEPAVVDAGALEAIARAVTAGTVPEPGRLLLTPHAGECARTLGLLGHPVDRSQVEDEPSAHAALLAGLTGATVLLKGATTVVAAPDGRLGAHRGAPAWLATAGSGDVLSGILGMLLAAGLEPYRAALVGAHVHAASAARASGGGPVRASGLVGHLAAAVAATRGDG